MGSKKEQIILITNKDHFLEITLKLDDSVNFEREPDKKICKIHPHELFKEIDPSFLIEIKRIDPEDK